MFGSQAYRRDRLSVRRAYRCEACRIVGVSARGLSAGFVCISARGLSDSQGRTVRGLSVRRRIGTRTCQIRRAYRCEACRIGFVCISARGLSDSQGSTVRGLSGRRRIGTTGYRSRIAGVAARGLSVRRAGQCKACQQVGRLQRQQYDASTGSGG